MRNLVSELTGGREAQANPSQKKALVVLLRWILVIASSYLILFSESAKANLTTAHLIVLVLIGSNLIVSFLPQRFFTSKFFDHALVLTDIILISGSVWITGQVTSDFYLLYFLVIMIAAVSDTIESLLSSATVIAVVYLAMTAMLGGIEDIFKVEVLIRVPFLFVVAIFYGHLVQAVRSERKEKAVYKEKLSVAGKLRELSGTLAMSLDRKKILESLVQSVQEFTGAEYCGVISRVTREVGIEAGTGNRRLTEQEIEMFLANVTRRVNQRVKTLMSASGSIEERNGSGAGLHQGNVSMTMFRVEGFTFLPITGHSDSDLFLCIRGNVDADTLDYCRLFLTSAALALKNAGQYQALLHEVENRQQLVRQLGQALKFKSQVVANVSHELRTPLHSMIGFGELLEQGGYGEMEVEQTHVVHRMIENARELLGLINNILDLSKLEAEEVRQQATPGHLKDFVDDIAETCSPLLRDKPVAMRVDVPKGLPIVVTDWGLMRHIALNLVSNAIKFTSQGEVLIAAEFDAQLGQLTLRVKDSGIGIEPAKYTEIFEPFRQLDSSYSRKYAGTGLGLAITKRQVEILGGKITVSSVPKQGAEFIVVIPVATIQPGSAPAQSLPAH